MVCLLLPLLLLMLFMVCCWALLSPLLGSLFLSLFPFSSLSVLKRLHPLSWFKFFVYVEESQIHICSPVLFSELQMEILHCVLDTAVEMSCEIFKDNNSEIIYLTFAYGHIKHRSINQWTSVKFLSTLGVPPCWAEVLGKKLKQILPHFLGGVSETHRTYWASIAEY